MTAASGQHLSVFGRLARLATTPVRAYVNSHVETLKGEARLHAALQAEVTRESYDRVMGAVDRLEQAIGVLGWHLERIREDVQHLDGGPNTDASIDTEPA